MSETGDLIWQLRIVDHASETTKTPVGNYQVKIGDLQQIQPKITGKIKKAIWLIAVARRR